jgi:hypothetical protein
MGRHNGKSFNGPLVREQQIGGPGGSLDPPAPLLEPPGPLLTHLHTVYTAYSEHLPTRLNPLAERTCFSQPLVGIPGQTAGSTGTLWADPCGCQVVEPPRGAREERRGGRAGGDDNVMLTPPPCIFHQRCSIQNIQGGGARMTPTSTPRDPEEGVQPPPAEGGAARQACPLHQVN